MFITEGGKLLRCSVAGRCWERLVLLRPLRSDERLRELPEVPPEGTTAPALAPFRGMWSSSTKGRRSIASPSKRALATMGNSVATCTRSRQAGERSIRRRCKLRRL